MQHQSPAHTFNGPAFIGGYTPLLIVAFIIGVVLYFALPAEPRVGQILPLSIGLALIGGVAVLFGQRVVFWYGGWFVLLLTALLLGMAYTTYRTSLIQPAFWPQKNNERVWVNGTVTQVNLRSNGFATVHLNNVTSYASSVQSWPKMVIITHNSRAEDARAGGQVAAQVRLKPPQVPLHRAQHDWRRNSFFEGVSATGLVMGDFYTTPPASSTFNLTMRDTRERIAQNYVRGKNDAAGGVAAALLTGLRSGIPPQTREDFSRSGLAHLMAISGMHLGMVAGFIYLLMRFFLVRIGHLPLLMDIRKPAALVAFLGAGGYALMAGATIPTIRALALISAALLAILSDRRHLGVRILALIAFALALYQPYWVAGPSFQLSFVASFALLLWAYRKRELQMQLGRLAPKVSKVGSIFQASLVASLATTPLVAFHFGEIPLMGVFANVLAVPYLGLVVLPLGFLSLLPLGVGALIKPLYLLAVKLLNGFASYMAHHPISTVDIPLEAQPLIFICVWSFLLAFVFSSWRVMAIGGLAAVPIITALITREVPLMYVYQGGQILASQEGVQVFANDNKKRRALEKVAENFTNKPTHRLNCDANLCSYKHPNEPAHIRLTIAKPWGSISPEDCRYSTWVFARMKTPCQTKKHAHKNTGQNIWPLIKEKLNNMTLVTVIITPKGRLKLEGYRPPHNRPWHIQ